MKKRIAFWIKSLCLVISIIMIVPCVFCSCSSNEDELREKIENEILGTWRGVDRFGDIYELTFNPDGTIKYKYYDHISGYEKNDSGVYEILVTRNGNEVWMDLEESYLGSIECIYNEDNGSLTLKRDEIYFAKVN